MVYKHPRNYNNCSVHYSWRIQKEGQTQMHKSVNVSKFIVNFFLNVKSAFVASIFVPIICFCLNPSEIDNVWTETINFYEIHLKNDYIFKLMSYHTWLQTLCSLFPTHKLDNILYIVIVIINNSFMY